MLLRVCCSLNDPGVDTASLAHTQRDRDRGPHVQGRACLLALLHKLLQMAKMARREEGDGGFHAIQMLKARKTPSSHHFPSIHLICLHERLNKATHLRHAKVVFGSHKEARQCVP